MVNQRIHRDVTESFGHSDGKRSQCFGPARDRTFVCDFAIEHGGPFATCDGRPTRAPNKFPLPLINSSLSWLRRLPDTVGTFGGARPRAARMLPDKGHEGLGPDMLRHPDAGQQPRNRSSCSGNAPLLQKELQMGSATAAGGRPVRGGIRLRDD